MPRSAQRANRLTAESATSGGTGRIHTGAPITSAMSAMRRNRLTSTKSAYWVGAHNSAIAPITANTHVGTGLFTSPVRMNAEISASALTHAQPTAARAEREGRRLKRKRGRSSRPVNAHHTKSSKSVHVSIMPTPCCVCLRSLAGTLPLQSDPAPDSAVCVAKSTRGATWLPSKDFLQFGPRSLHGDLASHPHHDVWRAHIVVGAGLHTRERDRVILVWLRHIGAGERHGLVLHVRREHRLHVVGNLGRVEGDIVWTAGDHDPFYAVALLDGQIGRIELVGLSIEEHANLVRGARDGCSRRALPSASRRSRCGRCNGRVSRALVRRIAAGAGAEDEDARRCQSVEPHTEKPPGRASLAIESPRDSATAADFVNLFTSSPDGKRARAWRVPVGRRERRNLTACARRLLHSSPRGACTDTSSAPCSRTSGLRCHCSCRRCFHRPEAFHRT